MNTKTESTEPSSKAGTASLGDYYSASQLRTDRWNQLKGVANQLANTSRERTRIQMIEKARHLLAALEPIETYWGFPGTRGLDTLSQMLVRDDHREFAASVMRTVRSMMSGAYRHKSIKATEGQAEDDEAAEAEVTEAETSATAVRPYFEVLIVDQLSPKQQESQRTALRAMRRKDDAFVYEPVVVPSFEDALIAVLFNHNIQTVVVRYDFAFESQHKLKILNRYLNRVGDEDINTIEPEDYGPELCRLLRKVRPELDVFLVTDRSVEDIAGRDLGGCQRVFYNQEDYMELHLNILRAVQQRYETPFFTALKAYTKQPTGVFHAMPITRGKSIVEVQLDPRHAGLLRPEHLPGRDLGHLRRARLAARAARPDQEGAGTGGARLRLAQDLLRHQRHRDLQQDRGAGPRAAGRHRAGRPRLPQVAPLRHGAGRRAGGLPGHLPADRVLDVRRGAAARDQAPPARAEGAPASSTACACCC